QVIEPSLDWFQADRSQIDAQILVSDFGFWTADQAPGLPADPYSIDTGSGWYYAVVRNQEGSRGNYRIEVDAPSPQLMGNLPSGTLADPHTGQTIYLPSSSPNNTLRADFIERFDQFAGYFPVQLSDYHGATLQVASAGVGTVAPNGLWDFDLFDAAG